MTDVNRRREDRDDFDPAQVRSAEFGASWNGKGIKARGLGVVVALAVLAIVGSNLYAGWRVETAISTVSRDKSDEHRTIRTSQDRTSCIVAMDPKDREKFRETYAPGAFKKWCPWVEE